MREQIVDGKFKYTRLESNQIFESLPDLVKTNFKVEFLTLHWSAGAYHDSSNYYHFNVGGSSDSEGYLLASNQLNTRWHYHLPFSIPSRSDIPNRNPNNLGLSFLAMAGATQHDMGKYPITHGMVETMAKTIALLKKEHNLNWGQVVDHAHFAKIDKYESYRWDCRFIMPSGRYLTDEVIQKAKWYFNKYLKG
jgi:hypothetical protein